MLNAQFINIIPEIIRLGAPEFMPAFLKPFNTNGNFVLYLIGQPIEPSQKGGVAILVAIEYYGNLRQLIPPS